MTEQSTPYTELPNYLVDEDYLAKMSGNAFKCYAVINRFTRGFKREGWCLDSAFLMRKLGIKKSETITNLTRELEALGLVKIVPKKGYPNEFFIADPSLQTVAPMNGGTPSDRGETPPSEQGESTHHQQGETPPSERGTKKETIKNKQIERNNNSNGVSENQQVDRPIQFVTYHVEDQKQYGMLELVSEYKEFQVEFIQTAQPRFTELSESDLKNLMQEFGDYFASKASKNTPSIWITKWLKWVQNNKDALVQRCAEKPKALQKPNQRNVNDAWGEPKKYAPVTEGKA